MNYDKSEGRPQPGVCDPGTVVARRYTKAEALVLFYGHIRPPTYWSFEWSLSQALRAGALVLSTTLTRGSTSPAKLTDRARLSR